MTRRMILRDRLRQLAEALPPGVSVTLTREGLLALAELEPGPADPPLTVDLTVAQVGALLGRRPGTIRAWCGAGLLWSYKLNGREWRVPPAAVEAFQVRQREGKRSEGSAPADRPAGGLGDWRTVRRGPA